MMVRKGEPDWDLALNPRGRPASIGDPGSGGIHRCETAARQAQNEALAIGRPSGRSAPSTSPNLLAELSGPKAVNFLYVGSGGEDGKRMGSGPQPQAGAEMAEAGWQPLAEGGGHPWAVRWQAPPRQQRRPGRSGRRATIWRGMTVSRVDTPAPGQRQSGILVRICPHSGDSVKAPHRCKRQLARSGTLHRSACPAHALGPEAYRPSSVARPLACRAAGRWLTFTLADRSAGSRRCCLVELFSRAIQQHLPGQALVTQSSAAKFAPTGFIASPAGAPTPHLSATPAQQALTAWSKSPGSGRQRQQGFQPAHPAAHANRTRVPRRGSHVGPSGRRVPCARAGYHQHHRTLEEGLVARAPVPSRPACTTLIPSPGQGDRRPADSRSPACPMDTPR